MRKAGTAPEVVAALGARADDHTGAAFVAHMTCFDLEPGELACVFPLRLFVAKLHEVWVLSKCPLHGACAPGHLHGVLIKEEGESVELTRRLLDADREGSVFDLVEELLELKRALLHLFHVSLGVYIE